MPIGATRALSRKMQRLRSRMQFSFLSAAILLGMSALGFAQLLRRGALTIRPDRPSESGAAAWESLLASVLVGAGLVLYGLLERARLRRAAERLRARVAAQRIEDSEA